MDPINHISPPISTHILTEPQFAQYISHYKTQLCYSNGAPMYDTPYNNPVFDELVVFCSDNVELFLPMVGDNIDIWNERGKTTLLDKYKRLLGILIYGYDNYYPQKIKNTYADMVVVKPPIIVTYIENRTDIPHFLTTMGTTT